MPPLSRDDALDRARELAPVLRQRAESTERLRRLPDESLRDIQNSGLVRVFQPRRLGGGEMHFSIFTEVGAELARGCASSAWVWANMAAHQWMLGMWTEEAQNELWNDSPETLISGAFAYNSGRAKAVEGGYLLSGQWPFVSGVDCCDWTMIGAMEDGESGSPPSHRAFIVPAKDYEIIDNWHVSGLCGTGSKDISVKEVFVPAHRTITPWEWRGGKSPGSGINPGALYKLPVIAVLPYCLNGVALGIAEGAWDDFVTESRSRVATYSGAAVANFPANQLKVAEAEVMIDSARLIMMRDCAEFMAEAEAGEIPGSEKKLNYRRNGAYATNLCVRAVDLMFTASGGGGLYNSNPIQRAFRDIHAAAAHFSMHWESAAMAHGKVALGLPPDNPLL